MKNIKLIAFVAVSLYVGQVFAQTEATMRPKTVSEVQIKQAISLLLKAGVISLDEAKLVLKRPSMLEELTQQGYVETGYSEPSAICLKQ